MATKKAAKATTPKSNGARPATKNGAVKPEKGTEAYYVEKANRMLEKVLKRMHEANAEEQREADA